MSLYPLSHACPTCGAKPHELCSNTPAQPCFARWEAAIPTTNPETAGVEPVAFLRTHKAIVDAVEVHLKPMPDLPFNRARWTETPLYVHPPAAREDGEKLDKAFSQITHSIKQARIPGNDWKRELALIENTVKALATTRPAPEQAPEGGMCEALDEKAIRHDERKRIIAGGCIHTRKAADQDGDGDRADIVQWQTDGKQWFDATICEIVSEYAAWRDKQAPDHANCAVGEGEPTPEPTPQQGLGEGLVERAKAAMLANLRDRRLLKWLFAENADSNPVPIGYVDGPIDEATQDEIVETLARLTLAAMPTPAAIRAETTAQIVAWLRQRQEIFRSEYAVSVDPAVREIADAIERGDRLTRDAT